MNKSFENSAPVPILHLGIGCRKYTAYDTLREVIHRIFDQYGWFMQSVKRIASIDLKQEEPAILQLAKVYQIPTIFYTSQQLKSCPGTFSASPYVLAVTGVDNVCERAAFLSSGYGIQLLAKQANNGVTVAVYQEREVMGT